jgi:toxin ParE1/3/4
LFEASFEKDELLHYIEAYSVLAALGLDEQICRQVAQLATFPFLGRKGRIANSFELVISRTPYIVAYRIVDGDIQILHIYHERRAWPPEH